MKSLIISLLILLLAILNHTIQAQQNNNDAKAPKKIEGIGIVDDDDGDDNRSRNRSWSSGDRKKRQTITKEFKFETKGKKLKISSIAGKVEISSHNKSEILIVGEITERNVPKNAEGLTKVTSSGEDNTGVNLNIKEEEGVVYLKKTGNDWEGGNAKYKILIPEKMNLTVIQKGYDGKTIKITNIKTEIEVKSSYSAVVIENVTGPLILSATYSKAKVSFDKLSQEKPSSIIGAYSEVDVTLPSDTKSDLKLESDYGNIYTDFELQKKETKKDDDDEDFWCVGCKKNIESKINGGGVELYIKSPYGNIYLRKKK